MCMCVCANHALGGHREKAVGQDGEGQEAKDEAPSPQGEEGTVTGEDGRGHSLGHSRSQPEAQESIVAVRTPGYAGSHRT